MMSNNSVKAAIAILAIEVSKVVAKAIGVPGAPDIPKGILARCLELRAETVVGLDSEEIDLFDQIVIGMCERSIAHGRIEELRSNLAVMRVRLGDSSASLSTFNVTTILFSEALQTSLDFIKSNRCG